MGLSGADLEYQRMLADANISPLAPSGYDGPRLEQLADQRVVDGIEDLALAGKANKAYLPFNVKDYGAVGDNSTDDTAAINACIAAAAAVGGLVVFPTVGSGYPDPQLPVGYKTTATIDFPSTVDVDMGSQIIGHNVNGPLIRYNPSGPSYAENHDLTFAARRQYGGAAPHRATDWATENNIGIQIRNVNRSRIYIRQTVGNTIGLEALGDGGGFVYNEVILGFLYDNKYAINCRAINGGWTNENNWYGGNFQLSTTTNTTQSRYGIRFRTDSNQPNNNIFYKPSFELHQPTGGAESIPIIMETGLYNKFLNVRNEDNSTTIIRTSGTAQLNEVTEGYSPVARSVVDDIGSFPSTIHKQAVFGNLDDADHLVFNETDLGLRAVPYDVTKTNIPGLALSATGAATLNREQAGFTITGDYLDFSASNAAGLMVDTTVVKHFVFSVDAVVGRGGRLIVRCYDAAGVVLDPAVYAADPLVKGNSSSSLAAITSFGGVYRTGLDSNDPRFFKVSSLVKSIYVAATGGTATIQLRGIRLSTTDTSAVRTWSPFTENDKSTPVAIQAPSSGTHSVGRRVYHGAPAVGQPQGWVCTVAGTPGTWVPFPIEPVVISASDPRLGFVGDGTTDNAAAWARLDALMTGPIIVQFPSGVFRTNINGVSAFTPNYDITIEGVGVGTQFTTTDVTVSGNLITPGAAINLVVKNVRATATATGPGTAQFINTSVTSGTSKYRLEDVTLDGAWTTGIKAGANGTEIIDVICNRVTFNLTIGTGILNSAAGGRIHCDNSTWTAYGLTASNQQHGIYCYQRIAMRLRGCNFYSNNSGSGRAYQHFGSTGTPEYSITSSCYFGASSGGLTSYVSHLLESSRILGTGSNIVARSDMDIVNCHIAGNVTFGGDATAGSIVRIRGGESTLATAIVTANVTAMVIDVSNHNFRGLATNTNPFDGSQLAGCTKSIINCSYGAAQTRSSTTANRPSATSYGPAGTWQDTTLGKRVFSDGTNWLDATGAVV